MKIPDSARQVIDGYLRDWVIWVQNDGIADELRARDHSFDYACERRPRGRPKPPRAKKYAQWCRTSETRNRPKATVPNINPNPTMATLHHRIEEMPDLWKEVLVMTFVHGWNPSKTAKEIDRSMVQLSHTFNDIYLYLSGHWGLSLSD